MAVGAERLDLVERRRPVVEVGVAGVGGRAVLDQVAAEEDLLLRQPGDGVALGVAAAELHQPDFELAEPDRHLALEGERRPGQAGDRLDGAEQAREALDLALHVGRAALDDQVARVLAGDDLARAVRARAEHAHRVVVAHDDVLDRLVGDFADVADDVLRHHRRRLGVDHHHRVVADDDAGVRIALGGVRVGVVGELGEGDLLVGEVGLGGECFAHGGVREGRPAAVKRDGSEARNDDTAPWNSSPASTTLRCEASAKTRSSAPAMRSAIAFAISGVAPASRAPAMTSVGSAHRRQAVEPVDVGDRVARGDVAGRVGAQQPRAQRGGDARDARRGSRRGGSARRRHRRRRPCRPARPPRCAPPTSAAPPPGSARRCWRARRRAAAPGGGRRGPGRPCRPSTGRSKATGPRPHSRIRRAASSTRSSIVYGPGRPRRAAVAALVVAQHGVRRRQARRELVPHVQVEAERVAEDDRPGPRPCTRDAQLRRAEGVVRRDARVGGERSRRRRTALGAQDLAGDLERGVGGRNAAVDRALHQRLLDLARAARRRGSRRGSAARTPPSAPAPSSCRARAGAASRGRGRGGPRCRARRSA